MSDLPPLAAGTAAGWHDDPADPSKLRYWDGAAWTDRVAHNAAKLPQSGPTPSSTITPGPAVAPAKPASNVGRGCLLSMIAVVALIVIASIFSSGSDDDGKAGAISVCEQFVTRRLRSPGTADFQTADFDHVSNSGETYTYSAFVDSQNGFGAVLRSSFTCVVEHTGGDSYRLVSLDLNEL